MKNQVEKNNNSVRYLVIDSEYKNQPKKKL